MVVVTGAHHRRVLEVAAVHARLDRERHDEVGLVEVPVEHVACGHHGEVERPDRIGVPVQRLAAQDPPEEGQQLVDSYSERMSEPAGNWS